MDSEAAILALGALAQGTRLEVFRLLVRHEPRGLPAGEIARQLGVPHNTMSAHLGQLARCGLIRSVRQGRSIIYRADLAAIRRLVAFLLENCCGGASTACVTPLADLVCCPQEEPVHD
jgi:ArsR family transcriptional regulator